ncbi:hypothetical protein EYF80_049375 [Liparis tanakae]|uniref:Uncharacterized protein n=1 Tax=Liparis tanakae TaxID=230148 RepID=A0A4Z2FI58_9TELE|nr:hypothetical protein EYF80_049375 [Liparis tanakae]
MVSDIAEVSSVALGGAHLLPSEHSHSLNMGFSHAANTSQRKAAERSCDKVTDRSRAGTGGPEWREGTVETERDRNPLGPEPEEMWYRVQGWDETNFETSGILPTLSSSSLFL